MIGENYVLILRDNHSDYKRFFANDTTDAEYSALAIIDWFLDFVVPNALMSHGPTHFKNGTVRFVSKVPKVVHHFKLPY